jgi:hypothetical protein
MVVRGYSHSALCTSGFRREAFLRKWGVGVYYADACTGAIEGVIRHRCAESWVRESETVVVLGTAATVFAM